MEAILGEIKSRFYAFSLTVNEEASIWELLLEAWSICHSWCQIMSPDPDFSYSGVKMELSCLET